MCFLLLFLGTSSKNEQAQCRLYNAQVKQQILHRFRVMSLKNIIHRMACYSMYLMLWYGSMVSYDMVVYLIVSYGILWYGMVWYLMVCCGVESYEMVWYLMLWNSMEYYVNVWYLMEWYGILWYGIL